MKFDNKIQELAFDNLPRALIIFDPHGEVIFVNKKTEKILGKSQKFFEKRTLEKIGKLFKRYHGTSLVSAFKKKVAIVNQSELFKTKGGKEIKIEYSFYPLAEGERVYAYLLSVRRQSIIEYDQGLFIAALGHELKTPLSVLLSYSHLLEQAFLKQDYQRFKKYSSVIEERTSNLIKLSNALLDAIRLGSGKLIFNDELIRVDSVLREFVRQIQKTTSSHKLKYEAKTRKKIKIDKERLFQIISNLANNAIKYSPDAEEISIKLLRTEDHLQIQVQDNGLGIGNKAAKEIFKPFFREYKNGKKNLKGLGMGLFLTKQIVNHYNGHIYFVTEKNEGTTFFVNLPI